MAGSVTSELRAEPNLTPLLDVVFQLITFFMLVINFSNENYDQRVRLPVAGSARPSPHRRHGPAGLYPSNGGGRPSLGAPSTLPARPSSVFAGP